MTPEDRAWAVVRAAYLERTPAPRRRRGRRRTAAVVALAAAAVAAALSPPGQAVVDAVRRTIGVEHAAPALFRLPAPGRLLVSGAGGAWVVHADGSKRRLGDWSEASWSPHGLFVVVARANELAALTPDGKVHWSLARRDVAFPRWAGSRVDTRIAYLSGTTLRIVGGDGRGDRAVARAARVAPAWRPGARFELAYVTPAGAVHTLGGRRVAARARAVAWSQTGVVATQARAVAVSRTGRVAVLRDHAVVELRREGGRRTLFATRGRLEGLAWSPDGRWLVTALPEADQWVFVGPRGVVAVANIARQFGGSVSLDGWAPGA